MKLSTPFRILWLVAAAAAPACISGGPDVKVSAPLVVPGYLDRAPVEVAVVPIAPVPEFSTADALVLAEALYQNLLEKGYTPLAPEHVSRRLSGMVREGGAPPSLADLAQALPADGYFMVTMEDVKRRPHSHRDEWSIGANAVLVDGRDGTSLFEHRLALDFPLPQGTVTRLEGSEQKRVLDRFADRLTGPLPARRAAPPGAENTEQ